VEFLGHRMRWRDDCGIDGVGRCSLTFVTSTADGLASLF